MSVLTTNLIDKTGVSSPKTGSSSPVVSKDHTVKPPADAATVTALAPKEQDGQSKNKHGDRGPAFVRELEQGAKLLDKMALVFDFKLQFRVHKDSNRIFAKVLDPESGKVLREIPPEKVLDLVAQMEKVMAEMSGKALDDYI